MQVYSPTHKSWELYFGSLVVSGEGSAMGQKTSTVMSVDGPLAAAYVNPGGFVQL